MRPRRILAAAAAVALLLSGCAAGDDDAGGNPGNAGDAEPAAPTTDLPPDGTEPMAGLYDDNLEPLGWKVQRSSLEEQHIDTSVSIPPGKRHLALYLRPTGRPTPNDYFDALVTVTRLFVPSVFEEYKGLASFDVCLEPTEALDPSGYPKPLTQVLVSRAQSTQLDWGKAVPADVVAGSNRHPNSVALFVAEGLKNSPEWAALDKAAAART